MSNEPEPTINELYPHLTVEELKQAEENLDRYLALVLRIFKRLEAEEAPAKLTPGTGTLGFKASSSQA